MFWLIFGRKEVKRLKEETKKAFDFVKKDIGNVEEWIKHFNYEKEFHKKEIKEVRELISKLQEDLEELKQVSSIASSFKQARVFKTPSQNSTKQTAVYAVQTGVQTGVQTPNLDQFSVTERAIIWALLNTDMKLSYEDLAAILGKEKTTIRGQINSIKQKSEGLIEEIIEKNGKKRVFIPEKMKEILLKKAKVRVKKAKRSKKTEQNQ